MEEQEQIEARKYPLKHSAAFAGGTFLAALPFEIFGHLGPTGLLVGGLASYVAWKHGPEIYESIQGQVRGMVPPPASSDEVEPSSDKRDWLDRAFGIGRDKAELKEAREEEDQIVDGDPLFAVDASSDTGGIDRLTIEQIVANCEPNSFKIFIGRSLTKPGNKAVRINFYKQHFRFIGASQRGKSSMLAAFLEVVTRTHDPEHVRLILLDKEDKTSNLFAHLPHMLMMKKPDGNKIKLHARNVDEVLEYLIHSVVIMEHRISLPTSKIVGLPVILVYLEEFLRVKDELKIRISQATSKEAKDKAASDYETFMFCIKALAQQGLKVRVQLLLCAQTEYADEDFREAMANIGCGFSFCVRPSVANSAGFRNNTLLQKNAERNRVGEAVVETPDCNDLVQAPDFDLEARLVEFETNQSGVHQSGNAPSEQQNIEVNTQGENVVNAPMNSSEQTVNTASVHQPFTVAQEVRVVLAFAEMSKSSDEKISRRMLRDYLGWNNKQWDVLKAICDKNKILMD